MSLSKAMATTLLVARESVNTPGTAPSSGWIMLQPEGGGLQGMNPAFESVTREPLSKYMTPEAGDHVGMAVAPKLVHDLTLDLVDTMAELWFRTSAKHPGATGASLHRPTAVVDGGGSADSFTVAANGALAANTLVHGVGFTNSENNALFVVTSGSDATSIKVPTASLVAETPPANAQLNVVGFQGATSDIELDGSGNLTSTTLNFVTSSFLYVGQRIKIGGSTAGTQFTTAAYNGYATVAAVAANLVTLTDRTWTPSTADDGDAKTIQIFCGRFYRNRAVDDAEYLEGSLHGEQLIASIGSAGVSMYRYLEGLYVKTFELDAPLKSKIVTTTTFQGFNIEDPVAAGSRVSGPSSAYLPLRASLFDTSRDMSTLSPRVTIVSSGASLVTDVNSWKLTLEHNVEPKECQGDFGASGMIFGGFTPKLSMETYLTSSDQIAALRANTEVAFRCLTKNEQGACYWNLPGCKLRKGDETYSLHKAVMMSLDIPGHRETTNNIAASLTVFPYLPT